MVSFYGILFSLVALGTLVAGDPNTIITINSATVTNNGNDFFDAMSVELAQTDESTKITVKIPVKQDLPESMMVKAFIQLEDQDPVEFEMSVCDGMEDDMAGKSFVEAGTPKDEFPKQCPWIAGDWTIYEWVPPAEKVPSGIPDGPLSGYMRFFEEGKDPYVQIDFEGEMTHKEMGR